MLPPEDRELLKSSRKASVSAPSPFQRPYFGSANAAEYRASSSAPKPVVKPHPVKSGFTKDPHSGSANAAEHRVLVKPHPVKSGFTKGSYSGSANAAEHRQILNVQKEDQAVKKVQIEQQKRLAKIPNYHNAAVNSEMREAVITQVHQDALKDPAYRAHEARVKRETDLSLKVQRDRALQELSKQQPQEKKSWWDEHKGIVHGALDVAGFIPGLGTVADLTNSGIYLAEGDKANAALSAIAAAPGVGDAVAATAIGAKVAIRASKATKGIEEGAKLAKDGEKAAKASSGLTVTVDEMGRTKHVTSLIDGPHPGRVKGKPVDPWQKPDYGVHSGDHVGHLIPEGAVHNPRTTNISENVISEHPASNLGRKKAVDNIASRAKAENPNSEVRMSAELFHRGTETRPHAVRYTIERDGKTIHNELIPNPPPNAEKLKEPGKYWRR